MTNTSKEPGHTLSDAWDSYVESAKTRGEKWPGDDWGDEELWRLWFERLFVPFGVATWERAIEIGQGTGKYTKQVLRAGPTHVLACDVSSHFLELCGERLTDYVSTKRLHLRRIKENDPCALQAAVRELGWSGHVDALFSIDTMVHLSFTAVACYMLAGTEVLRRDGYLIFTFANGRSGPGLRKMIQDMDQTVRGGGHPGTFCFHWISPELVRSTASFMGYSVEICDLDPHHGRDGHFVGMFTDPEKAEQARQKIEQAKQEQEQEKN